MAWICLNPELSGREMTRSVISVHHRRMSGTKWTTFADMAELADAPDLGSGGNPVQVQVLLSAAWNRAVLQKLHDFFELYGRGHL